MPPPVRGDFDRQAAFWSKVLVKNPNQCWRWKGAYHKKKKWPYGKAHSPESPGKTIDAHRMAWMLAFGAIPSGKMVLHRCDSTLCVNPHHLYLGTAKDNMRDAVERSRMNQGTKNGRSKLKPQQIRAIRRREAAGEKQVDIAEDYGISQAYVSMICRREKWKHLQ